MNRKLLWAVSVAAVCAPLAALVVRERDDRRADEALRGGLEQLDAPIAGGAIGEELDWRAAERSFSEASRTGSDDDRSRRARALWYACHAMRDLARGEAVLAATEVQGARRDDPGEPHVRFVEAAVTQRRGERRRAMQMFEVLARDPAVPDALRLRAGVRRLDLLLDEGDGHAAVAAAESVTSRSPGTSSLQNRLGLARGSVGDAAGARAAFETAHRIAPDDPSPMVNLARLARQSGDLASARNWLEQALARDGSDGEARLGYAVVLSDLGDTAHARDAAREAAHLLPDSAGPWNALGEIDLREGHLTEAAADFRAALERSADDSGARTNLGVVLARSGDREGAMRAFQAVTERTPAVGQAWNGLGAMRLSLGDPEGAVGPLEHAARLLSDDPNPAMNLGLAFERLHRWDEAARAFRETLRRAPGNESASLHLAAMQPPAAHRRPLHAQR